MTRNYLKMFSFLFMTILLVAGCQKQIKDQPAAVVKNEDELQLRDSHGGDKDGCRLISNTSEYGQETFTYNKKGLLDEWYIGFYNGYFKQEYDARGRLVKSRLYSEGVLVITIKFSYQDNKIVKETWYTGDTKEKWDEVFYYYNSKGQIRKNVSIIQDYINSFEYTRDGNVLKWAISVGGIPAYSTEFTYLHRHKNPFSATPGVGNAFPYANGAFHLNKWYSTSEKDTYYDEQGNPIVYVDQNPYKTIVKANGNDYVTNSDFFDNLTQEYVHFRFEYDNCDCKNDSRGQIANGQKSIYENKTNYKPFKLMKGASKSMKERVNELRDKLKTK